MPTSAANAAVPAPAARTTASNAGVAPPTRTAAPSTRSTSACDDGVPRELDEARAHRVDVDDAARRVEEHRGRHRAGDGQTQAVGRVPQLVGHPHRRHRQSPLRRVAAGDHAPDRVDDPGAPPGEARARPVGQPHQVGVDVGEPEDPRRPRRPLPHHRRTLEAHHLDAVVHEPRRGRQPDDPRPDHRNPHSGEISERALG